MIALIKKYPLPAVVFLYAVLAVLMTLPLVFHFSTHIPGVEGDGPQFLWNAWWFGKALTTSADFTYTTTILAPEGASLLFHTRTFVHDFLITLLTPLFGLVASFNLVFLLSFVASGSGMYLLAYRVTRHRIAAFIAGFIFAFAPTVTIRALAHFNLLAVWPIPWFFYFFFDVIRTQRLKPSILAGGILGLAILNGFYYPVFLLLLLFGILATLLFSGYRRTLMRKAFLGYGVLLLTAFAVASPLLVQYAQAFSEGTLPETGSIEEHFGFSADAVRYFLPSVEHPLFGEFSSSIRSVRFGEGAYIEEEVQYLGWSVIALALLGFVAASRAWAASRGKSLMRNPLFWAVTSFVAFVLSLGPAQRLPNGTDIPLPYFGLAHLPIFNLMRVPNRYSVLVIFAVAVLAAMGIAVLARRIPRRRLRPAFLLPLVLAVVLFEYAFTPMRILDVRLPEIYTSLPEDTQTILHVPFAIRDGLRSEGPASEYFTRYQLYQMYHGRPQVGGYLSRIPAEQFNTYLRTPGLRFLLRYPLDAPHPDDFSPRLVREALRERSVNVLVFDRGNIYLPRVFQTYIEEVIGAVPIARVQNQILYRVPQTVGNDLPDSLYSTVFPDGNP